MCWIFAWHDSAFIVDIVRLLPTKMSMVSRRGRFPTSGGKVRGKRIATALTRLGPGFIKLGQLLATRADIIGRDMAEELMALQDNLPPFSTKRALQSIETEFGRPWRELYAHIEEKPMAAASIAQVHAAVTTDGKHVAVKVIRPDVEAIFAKDFALFRWLAAWLDKRHLVIRRLCLPQAVETLEEIVRREMDLRIEASMACDIKGFMADDKRFYIPEIDWTRTSRRVLTMERIEGVRIDNHQFVQASGLSMETLAKTYVEGFFHQLFIHGLFHADLHPGNVLVDSKKRIVLLDFGITGRLDMRNRHYLAEIFRAFLEKDYRRVARLHFMAGWVPLEQSEDAFVAALRVVGEQIVGKSLDSIVISDLLAHLFSVATEFEMAIQPPLMMMQKGLLLVEGVTRAMCPSVNMWALVRPLIEKWQKDRGRIGKRVERMAHRLSLWRDDVPGRLMAWAKDIESVGRDGIKLHPETIEALAQGMQRRNRSPSHRVTPAYRLTPLLLSVAIGMLCGVALYVLLLG